MRSTVKSIKQVCVFCGAEYLVTDNGRNHKYCSDTCRWRAKAQRDKEKEQFRIEQEKANMPKAWTYESMLAARQANISYAERQKLKTLKMVGLLTEEQEKKLNG